MSTSRPGGLVSRLTVFPFEPWFIERLRAARRTVLMTHIDPDADGIGSQIAFAHAARQAGVDVRIVNNDPLPSAYGWLDDQQRVLSWATCGDALEGADLGLIFDASEDKRAGAPARALRDAGVDIFVLDHHPVGQDAHVVGAIDPSFSSTGELCYRLLQALDWPIDATVARGLYAAISFDTGSFRFLRNQSSTLRVAAELLDTGLEADPIHEALFASRPAAETLLLGRILARLQFAAEGRVAWVAVPHELFADLGLPAGATGEAMPLVIGIEGVVAAAMFKPGRAKGEWKLSLRSKKAARIGHIARKHGGGGHDHAAGATLKGSLEQVCAAIVAELEAAVSEGGT